MELQEILEKSSRNHSHLCPRQILGARIGLAGLAALGFREAPRQKQLLVIVETDGCFVSGVSAATDCTVGHRTLRVVDYGKVAAVFIKVESEQAIRIAPTLDVRTRAEAFITDETRHYFAQMQAYQSMPDAELITIHPVQLRTPVKEIVSRPGLRVNCESCGEEIMNEREVLLAGRLLCRSCAGDSYYD